MKQSALLDVDPAARHDADFYATPAFQTRALLRRIPSLSGYRVIEPCCGDGAIVRELKGRFVVTNDIIARPPMVPTFDLDARVLDHWDIFERHVVAIDVAITNPPFDMAYEIAVAAHNCALVALILLLRLSWLEPTKERGEWLAQNPPTRQIILPRYDYRQNGKTDSVTSAWCVWDKQGGWVTPGIDVVTRRECNELGANYSL